MSGPIRALSWNVNGLRAAHRKGFLDWFASADPDILCLQEVKAQPDQLPEVVKEIEGYHSYFSISERKGYSGVALYSKTEPDQVTFGFGIEEFDREGRVIIADYPEYTLFTIYYPNGQGSQERLEYKMRFYDSFLEIVERTRGQGKEIVVCGDLNTAHREIDLARPGPNEKISGFLPEERAWMDKFIQRGYVDTFRVFNQEPGNYTYWDQMSRARARNVGWRIDYFFVSEGFAPRVKGAYILPDVMGSDHCPVGIEIDGK